MGSTPFAFQSSAVRILFVGLGRRKSEDLMEIGKAPAIGLQHFEQVAHRRVIRLVSHKNHRVSAH